MTDSSLSEVKVVFTPRILQVASKLPEVYKTLPAKTEV